MTERGLLGKKLRDLKEPGKDRTRNWKAIRSWVATSLIHIFILTSFSTGNQGPVGRWLVQGQPPIRSSAPLQWSSPTLEQCLLQHTFLPTPFHHTLYLSFTLLLQHHCNDLFLPIPFSKGLHEFDHGAFFLCVFCNLGSWTHLYLSICWLRVWISRAGFISLYQASLGYYQPQTNL